MADSQLFRKRIIETVCASLRSLPHVVAAWEGGSAAFDALDEYSDIDLNFLVDDEAPLDGLYTAVAESLESVSPIVLTHDAPPGRYFKLEAGGEFLLIDVCFYRIGANDHGLDAERHGSVVPLFDRGEWLRVRPLNHAALASKRNMRYQDLREWFPVSQSFVRKAIRRGHDAEALGAYWACTVRPLMELLRMRHCPTRWDFGIRYVNRDLPEHVAEQFRVLVFVRDLEDLTLKLSTAEAWGIELLHELDAEQAIIAPRSPAPAHPE